MCAPLGPALGSSAPGNRPPFQKCVNTFGVLSSGVAGPGVTLRVCALTARWKRAPRYQVTHLRLLPTVRLHFLTSPSRHSACGVGA